MAAPLQAGSEPYGSPPIVTVPVVRAEVELSNHAHLGWSETGGRVHPRGALDRGGIEVAAPGVLDQPVRVPAGVDDSGVQDRQLLARKDLTSVGTRVDLDHPRRHEAEKLGFDVARRSRQDAVEVLRVALCLDERLAAAAGAPVVEGVAGGLP